MTSTTTTTGWAIRRKDDRQLYSRLDLRGSLIFVAPDDIKAFITPHKVVAEVTHAGIGVEVVHITRTVTVKIGEGEQ